MPEGQVAAWRFDDPSWIAKPSSNVAMTQNLVLAESWSGYALDMSGGGVANRVADVVCAPEAECGRKLRHGEVLVCSRMDQHLCTRCDSN
jgi:hypothetical protein